MLMFFSSELTAMPRICLWLLVLIIHLLFPYAFGVYPHNTAVSSSSSSASSFSPYSSYSKFDSLSPRKSHSHFRPYSFKSPAMAGNNRRFRLGHNSIKPSIKRHNYPKLQLAVPSYRSLLQPYSLTESQQSLQNNQQQQFTDFPSYESWQAPNFNSKGPSYLGKSGLKSRESSKHFKPSARRFDEPSLQAYEFMDKMLKLDRKLRRKIKMNGILKRKSHHHSYPLKNFPWGDIPRYADVAIANPQPMMPQFSGDMLPPNQGDFFVTPSPLRQREPAGFQSEESLFDPGFKSDIGDGEVATNEVFPQRQSQGKDRASALRPGDSQMFDFQQTPDESGFDFQQFPKESGFDAQQFPSSSGFDAQQFPSSSGFGAQQFPSSSGFGAQQFPSSSDLSPQQIPSMSGFDSQQFPSGPGFSSQQIPDVSGLNSQQHGFRNDNKANRSTSKGASRLKIPDQNDVNSLLTRDIQRTFQDSFAESMGSVIPPQSQKQSDQFGAFSMPSPMSQAKGNQFGPSNTIGNNAGSFEGFGEQRAPSKSKGSFGAFGDFGVFSKVDADCGRISTKVCFSSSDCKCHGYYTCIGTRCVLKNDYKDGGNRDEGSDPFGGVWHSGPVSDAVDPVEQDLGYLDTTHQ